MAVPTRDWLTLLKSEYLQRFIADRGCAIKFVRGEDAVLAAAEEQVAALSAQRLLPLIRVDAATTKLHMMQDIFFAVARETDWDALAQRWIEAVFRKNNYHWPRAGEPVPLRELADAYNVNESILRQEVLRWVTRDLMNVRELHQDFRSAMAALCMRRLEPVDSEAVAPVIEWLRGELRTIGAVRQVPISAKITRHNARPMLRSLCHWLRLVGGRGFVMVFDMRPVCRKESGGPVRYTPAAVLDVFEVLRQLIDEAEFFEGFLLLVLTDEHFVSEDIRRSLNAYPALQQRIYADVQAQAHENPLAPLLALAAPEQPGLRFLPPGQGVTEMPYLRQRVAIETLRAGVPNRTAVKLLGTNEVELAERFRNGLRKLRFADWSSAIGPREIIAGGFGAGKSHLLGYLGELAIEESFVVSAVTISKETPLFDAERIYAAAIRNARVADANDDIMTTALQRLRPGTPSFDRLEEWTSDPATGLPPIFSALLYLWPKQSLAPEDRLAIIRFLSGAKLGVARVRQWLRNSGAAKLFDLKTVKAPELAIHRLRFAPALFRAAGFSGWCVLLDEAELIGRYTRLQRAKSYGELGRWLGLTKDAAIPGLASVCCITADFVEAVLDRRKPFDEEVAPQLLEERGLADAAQRAVAALRALRSEQHVLKQPDRDTIARTLQRLRELYRDSYGWTPPLEDVALTLAGSDTMRHHIKSWITIWDIHRLYGEVDSIRIDEIRQTYDENPALEQAAPGDVAEEEVL